MLFLGAEMQVDLEKELNRLAATAPTDEREEWALKFLRDYLESGKKTLTSLELAIRSTHRATKLQSLLFAAYAARFEQDNFEILSQLRRIVADSKLLVMHLSCRPRLEKALASMATFSENGLRNLIVVGQDDPEDTRYHFDADRRMLTVPAPDCYEGLSRKSAAAYRMLGFAALNICVLKVDDDIRAVPDGFDPRYIISLADAHDYFGFLIDTRVVGFYRWWHFGKCADAALNASPYSMIATADYARGPAYVLSSRAVATLAQASIYYCRHFEIEGGYEDLAVGKALNAYDIHPANFDLEEKGLVYSTDSAS